MQKEQELLLKLQQKAQDINIANISEDHNKQLENIVLDRKEPKKFKKRSITSDMISTVSGATLIGVVAGGMTGAIIAGLLGYTLVYKRS